MTARIRTARSTLGTLAAGAVLLGGLLSGCGGGDDSSSAEPSSGASSSSTDASTGTSTGGSGGGSGAAQDKVTEAFCSTYADIVQSGSDDLAVQKKAIGELEKIGTPPSMDADAQKGYELLVQAISTAKTTEELSSLGEKLSQDETDKLLSFSQFLTTTCAAQLGVGN